MAKKLGIKPGHKVLVLNAPDGYLQALGPLPEGVGVATSGGGTFEVVQVFVRSKEDIDGCARRALEAVRPGGMLWFAYPKKLSKVKTDINRDVGWDSLTGAGWENIAHVSIDDTWSAGRFRSSSEVRSGRGRV
ncbi:MAG TPA: hypothetical protein VF914_22680 [Chloroflexia bacterium]